MTFGHKTFFSFVTIVVDFSWFEGKRREINRKDLSGLSNLTGHLSILKYYLQLGKDLG
jgi:hypothetical protein